MPPPLMTAIVVVELPALRRVDRVDVPPSPVSSAPAGAAGAAGGGGPSSGAVGAAPTAPQPRFVLVLPHGDPARLPKNVLPFCYPDVDELARYPFSFENSAEEYTFTLTSREEPRVYGFCRRYRLGSPLTGGRLDLSPYTSADRKEASEAPSYQCITILSERCVRGSGVGGGDPRKQTAPAPSPAPPPPPSRAPFLSCSPYQRFFSQCLQLLHAARLAGGGVAMTLARTLLRYNSAPAGSLLPLRSLCAAPSVPGCLGLARERLRVPPAVGGLPHADTACAPLLSRLDAPALLMLLTAMLCERRIMFVAGSLATLTSGVHAAVALLAPFEWQHIFIPVLSSAFLPFCCAPNPYIIGLTQPQFVALNEEYDIGEVVLVALDEGYVACLNGAPPLVDLEHGGPPSAHLSPASPHAPPGSGYISYAGPRLAPDRALARLAEAGFPGGGGGGGGPLSPGGGEAPRAGEGGFGLGLGLGEAAGGGGGGGGGSHGGVVGAVLSGMQSALAGGGGASAPEPLSPAHSHARSHAYDDEAVLARCARRAYTMRRVAARKAARERVRARYDKEPGALPGAPPGEPPGAPPGGEGGEGGEGGGEAARPPPRAQARRAAQLAGGACGEWGAAGGEGPAGAGEGGAGAASDGGWGACPPAGPGAAAGGGEGALLSSPPPRQLALRNPGAVVTPGGADHAAAASKRRLGGGGGGGGGEGAGGGGGRAGGGSERSGGGSGAGLASSSAAMLAALTGVALEAAAPTRDMELEGAAAAEFGAWALPVDLAALRTSGAPGGGEGGRRRRPSRQPGPGAEAACGAPGGPPQGGPPGDASLLRRAALGAMVARAGNAVWSMAKGGGGGAPPECPAGRLAHEVRGVYARERREGVFEEPALTAAIVAFAAVVLGRCTDFVTVEGNADLASGGG